MFPCAQRFLLTRVASNMRRRRRESILASPSSALYSLAVIDKMTEDEPLLLPKKYKKQKYKKVELIYSLKGDEFKISFDSWNWIFELLNNGNWSLKLPNGIVLSVHYHFISRAAKMILENQLDSPGIEIDILKLDASFSLFHLSILSCFFFSNHLSF